MMKMRRCNASATVEFLYIMPVIFLILVVAIYLGFFFHDKIALQGIVSEAIIIGRSNYRMTNVIDVETLEEFIYEKGEIRLLFFVIEEIEIAEEQDQIVMLVSAEKRQMKIELTSEGSLDFAEISIRENLLLGQIVEESMGKVWEVITDGN